MSAIELKCNEIRRVMWRQDIRVSVVRNLAVDNCFGALLCRRSCNQYVFYWLPCAHRFTLFGGILPIHTFFTYFALFAHRTGVASYIQHYNHREASIDYRDGFIETGYLRSGDICSVIV